jgi:hypothetical protein
MKRITAALLAALCCAGLTACTKTVAGSAVAGTTTPTTTSSRSTRSAAPDPSAAIEGAVVKKYPQAKHARPDQRVAYDVFPPMGGTHDGSWAGCDGVVYPNPVRNENMVHAMEHGAVWIAYHPDQVTGTDLDDLKSIVDGKGYLMLSPYPGLDKPVSVQSWGHQLKVDDAHDPRIAKFATLLRNNAAVTPEFGATCEVSPSGTFDPTNPPPFDPTPPGADALPVNMS